jgi:hypothetical protein
MTDNRVVVIYEGKMPSVDCVGYSIQDIRDTKDLEAFSLRTDTRVGLFPALVDITKKIWCPLDGTLVEANTKLDNMIQSAKSYPQMEYENAFFDLCKLILINANDPRATEDPTPKLGFDEISTLIEAYETTDFNASVKLSLKLLSLDASLKRFDMLWWDNAISHKSIR